MATNAVSATLSGLIDLVRPRAKPIPLGPQDDARGRRCLVTGANRGLGREIARQLAGQGAELVIACRREIDATAGLLRAAGAPAVTGHRVDLADLSQVTALADALVASGPPLDIVVLNAACVAAAARPTPQGLETMFAVNYLANVALMERLVAAGLVRARPGRAAPRVVVVSSESHRWVDALAPGGLSTLGTFRPFGMGESNQEYSRTKLLVTTYALDLARRLGPDASVQAICPGAVDTEIAREAPAWVKPVLYPIMRLFFQSPAAAARPVVYLACARAAGGRSGDYYHMWRAKAPAALAADPAQGRALRRASVALLARLGHPIPES